MRLPVDQFWGQPSLTRKSLAESLIQFCQICAVSAIEKAKKHVNNPLGPLKDKAEVEIEAIQKEWSAICSQDSKAPAVVDEETMKMTSLNEFKRAIIDQYHRIRISQRQGDSAASSYNIRFEGNTGTGKRTIARHYSKFLQQLTVLPEDSVLLDVTAASLKNKGISHLEELLEKIKEKEGGVIFIDKAYQLVTDKVGEKLLDFILPISEALDGPYGKLVWIFAGYPKEMKKLFEHNVGLPSRFPQLFTFSDYSAKELQMHL